MCIMKLISHFLFILITNISASFSSELKNAVLSVEDSFGKLFTDVVTDVKDTISCTLMAVEQAFAFNHFDRSSEYYKKCNGKYEQKGVTKKVKQQQKIPVLSNFKMLQERSSLLPVLSTFNEYLDQRDRRNNLENVKSVLNSGPNRLDKVNAILRQELDKMSSNVRQKINIFELNGRRPTVHSVWNHIKLLYDLEEEHKNSADATVIRRTIDEVLNVLDIHENSNTPEKDKIKDIMNNLENDSNDESNNIDNNLPVWKQNETYLLNNVQSPVEKHYNQTKKGRQMSDFPLSVKEVAKKIVDDKTILNATTSNNASTTNEDALNKTDKLQKTSELDDFPRSFKKVAKKIMGDKTIQNVTTSNNAITINDEALNKTDNLCVLTTQKPLTTTINPISASEKDDYDSFFQSSNEKEAMLAANQANEIIEDSKRSQMILDSIFGNSNGKEKSVFDDPEYSNFS